MRRLHGVEGQRVFITLLIQRGEYTRYQYTMCLQRGIYCPNTVRQREHLFREHCVFISRRSPCELERSFRATLMKRQELSLRSKHNLNLLILTFPLRAVWLRAAGGVRTAMRSRMANEFLDSDLSRQIAILRKFAEWLKI